MAKIPPVSFLVTILTILTLLSSQATAHPSSPTPSSTQLSITLLLQSNHTDTELAVAHLEAVSSPDSPQYGKYWTAEQARDFFAPSREQVAEVARWLHQAGVPAKSLRVSLDRSRVSFQTAAQDANLLFRTRAHGRQVDGRSSISLDGYQLPESMSDHIHSVHVVHANTKASAVYGNKKMALKQPLKLSAATPNITQVDCFKHMSPECLRLLYNFRRPQDITQVPQNLFGIYEPAWETWLEDDLDNFFSKFAPELVSRRPIVQPINGGYLQHDVQALPFNLEANLDFEYAMSLVAPLDVINVQVGDKYLLGNLNTMLAGFDRDYCETGLDPSLDPIYPDTAHPDGYNASDCGSVPPPSVISVSYTGAEAALPRAYAERQCLEFLRLGLRGTTVLVASGDRGAAANDGTCLDPPATGGAPTNATTTTAGAGAGSRFSPNFPASCPWVTTVGGTQLLLGAEPPPSRAPPRWSPGTPFPRQAAFRQRLRDNATVASSGGGFSNVFPAPFYQRRHVRGYLRHAEHRLAGLSAAGRFDPAGRGYPDVSALASDHLVSVHGKMYNVKGTSASTPVVASMIALVNAARHRVGKGPVGFVNPALYAFARAAVTDVEDGWNSGCGLEEAYAAVPGWDAATGLGWPDFEKLRDVFLSLP